MASPDPDAVDAAACGTDDRLFIGLWLLVIALMVMIAAASLYLFRKANELLRTKL